MDSSAALLLLAQGAVAAVRKSQGFSTQKCNLMRRKCASGILETDPNRVRSNEIERGSFRASALDLSLLLLSVGGVFGGGIDGVVHSLVRGAIRVVYSL